DEYHRLHAQALITQVFGDAQSLAGALVQLMQTMGIKEDFGESIQSAVLPSAIANRARLMQQVREIFNRLVELACRQVSCAAFPIDRNKPGYLLFGWQPGDKVERSTVMLRCLIVGVDLPAIVSRVDEELDCTSEVPAALEVHRELRGDPRRLVAVKSDHQ